MKHGGNVVGVCRCVKRFVNKNKNLITNASSDRQPVKRNEFRGDGIMEPLYITELFSYYTPAGPLRSSTDLSRLLVPKFHSVAGERRFAVTAAKAWNCLPKCIRTAQSTNVFKKSLKTHLF